MKALLSCFPHIIKFTCLKCIGQWVFSIFIKKCICHNLILGYFHHPERNPIPISHHSRSPNSTPPPQSALSNPRPTFCLWIYSFVFPLGFGCYLQSACEMCFHEFGKQKPSWVSAPGSAAADARAFGRRGCWQRPATLHVPVPASSSRLCSCDWSRCFVQFPQFWVSTTTSWSLACWFQGHHSETYLQPNPAPIPPSSPSSSSGCSLLPAPLIDGNAQSGCSSLIPNSHDAVFSCHE